MTGFSRILTTVSALALLGGGSIAYAQSIIFFPNSTTINYAVTGIQAWVGYDASFNRSSPTVMLINGGSIEYSLFTYNHSVFTMRGGEIGVGTGNWSRGLVAYENSVQMNYLTGSGDGVVNVRGGSIYGSIQANDNSVINLYGRNLRADLIDPNYSGWGSRYSISGTLQDGTAVNNLYLELFNGTSARFTLNNVAVPTPSSALVLLAGAGPGIAVLLRRRRN